VKKFIIHGGFVSLMTAALSAQGIGWRLIDAEIRHKFPDVPRISTSALAQWLADKKKAQPLLLDVRSAPEFEVSHLAGAIRVEPGADLAKLHLPNDKRIVTYCSVGYRSAALALRLHAAGYRNVENIEGSIFEWANENRPLVHDGKPTDRVHPYNAVWGMLLDKDRRARVD
jgi:rhodanese-related sulfurtransferase